MNKWMRWTKWSILGIGLVGLIAACGQPGVVPDEVQVNGIRVDRVDGSASGKVELSVSGLDSDGNVVTNARMRGASATVDNVENSTQSFTATARICGDITATPGDVAGVLMMDETGSMSSQDPDELRFDAAKRYVDDMRSSDVAAIARFSGNVTATQGLLVAEVMEDFTTDKAALNAAIDATKFESGLTPLWDAAHDAVTMLDGRSEPNRIAVVMTDGSENSSSTSLDAANQHAIDEGVLVYAVGFGGAQAGQLDDLVAGTGGFRILVEQQADIPGMFDTIFAATQAQGCVEVELSEQPNPGTIVDMTLNVQFDGGVSRSTTFRVQF